MIVNPMLDYHLVDIIETLDVNIINTRLNLHRINKSVNDNIIAREKENGKTKLSIVKIDFKEFLKKAKKLGLEKVHRRFIKLGVKVTEESLLDMYNKFTHIKKNTGNNYDYYIFFDK